jgi:hypothetical protein
MVSGGWSYKDSDGLMVLGAISTERVSGIAGLSATATK